MLAGVRGPVGVKTALQSALARNRVSWWSAGGGSTTITAVGASALTAIGTATLSNVALTNRYTRERLLEYLVTAASTSAIAGFRYGNSICFSGANPGEGGYHLTCRWGPSTGVATSTTRGFVGFRPAATPTDVDPSTLTSMVGMGWDNGDTNIQMMHNDASGTATKVDLGASFLRPSVDRTSLYELEIYCEPNGATIFYEVTDLASGAATSGSLTTNLPPTTTLLAPHGWMSVGGTSSVIGIALANMLIETEGG
jgi:hypothetical protein